MTLATYIETIKSPMHRAKAKAALEMQVRVNGGEFMFRHQLVERRISAGAKVVDHRGGMVLMNPDESWLDQRNITKHGLNYAAWLSVIGTGLVTCKNEIKLPK
jgi:hypothetical protein